MDRVLHRLESQVLLDLAAKPPRFLAPLRRSAKREIAVSQRSNRMIGKAWTGFGHPFLADDAMSDPRDVVGVVVEDREDAFLHFQGRAAARILDLTEIRSEIVRGGLAR